VKSPFAVDVEARDAAGPVARVTLQECRKGACADIAADTEAPWRFDVTLKKGKHVLQAVAVDAAGNRGTSAPVTVQVGKKTKRSAVPEPGEAGIAAGPSGAGGRDGHARER